MHIRTDKNDQNNKGGKNKERLLRSIWLGKWFWNITLQNIKPDVVQEVRALLDGGYNKDDKGDE